MQIKHIDSHGLHGSHVDSHLSLRTHFNESKSLSTHFKLVTVAFNNYVACMLSHMAGNWLTGSHIVQTPVPAVLISSLSTGHQLLSSARKKKTTGISSLIVNSLCSGIVFSTLFGSNSSRLRKCVSRSMDTFPLIQQSEKQYN